MNQWKSDKCKIVNTIDNFFQKTIDPIDSNPNDYDQTEKVEENLVSTSLMKCTKIFNVDGNENEFNEFEQESVDNDKKASTCIVNLNSQNIEFSKCSKLDSTNGNCFLSTVDSTDNCRNKHFEENVESTNQIKCVEMTRENKINEPKEKSVDDDIKSAKYFVDNSNNHTNIYKHNLETVTEKSYDIEYCKFDNNSPERKIDVSIEIDTSVAPEHRKCTLVEINLEQIKLQLKNLKLQKSERKKVKTRFFATIDPDKNIQAENELSREISKDMFSRVSSILILSMKYFIF